MRTALVAQPKRDQGLDVRGADTLVHDLEQRRARVTDLRSAAKALSLRALCFDAIARMADLAIEMLQASDSGSGSRDWCRVALQMRDLARGEQRRPNAVLAYRFPGADITRALGLYRLANAQIEFATMAAMGLAGSERTGDGAWWILRTVHLTIQLLQLAPQLRQLPSLRLSCP